MISSISVRVKSRGAVDLISVYPFLHITKIIIQALARFHPPLTITMMRHLASLFSTAGTAKRGRDGDEEVQLPRPPYFYSLPDVAHGTIASFLSDGYDGGNNRLRVSEVSRRLYESYGGSLTRAFLRYREDGSAARLAAMLQRQTKLRTVVMETQRAIPAFSQDISQSYCRSAESVDLREPEIMVTAECLDTLVVDGA